MNIAILIATLFIPHGSDLQLQNTRLDEGEIAYVALNDRESAIRIGKSGASASYVADVSAIRGSSYQYLDRKKFVVLAGERLSYNSVDDTMSYNNTLETNQVCRFHFEIPSTVDFDDVELSVKATSSSGLGGLRPIVTKIRTVGRVDVSLRFDIPAANIKVSDFKVRFVDVGNPSYTNDFTKMTYFCKDMLGHFDLNRLRNWAKHLYDGNRGEDWADYDAPSNVRIGDNGLVIGSCTKETFNQFETRVDPANTNQVVVLMDGRYAVKYYKSYSSINAGNITFTSIQKDEENGNITFAVSFSGIASFNMDNLKVIYSDSLNRKYSRFREIPYTYSNLTQGSVDVTVQSSDGGKNGFYVVTYGDSSLIVEITDTLKVNKLILKGDDSKWYQLHVNGGTITATEVQ